MSLELESKGFTAGAPKIPATGLLHLPTAD